MSSLTGLRRERRRNRTLRPRLQRSLAFRCLGAQRHGPCYAGGCVSGRAPLGGEAFLEGDCGAGRRSVSHARRAQVGRRPVVRRHDRLVRRRQQRRHVSGPPAATGAGGLPACGTEPGRNALPPPASAALSVDPADAPTQSALSRATAVAGAGRQPRRRAKCERKPAASRPAAAASFPTQASSAKSRGPRRTMYFARHLVALGATSTARRRPLPLRRRARRRAESAGIRRPGW